MVRRPIPGASPPAVGRREVLMDSPIPVLDLDRVRGLCNDDPLLAKELLAAFEGECHTAIRRLSQALVQVDWEAIQRYAVSLRQRCAAFGALALAHLLAQLEEAYGHSHAPWREWGALLTAAWRQLRQELRRVQFGSA